jgi:hypothetical protein
MDQRFVVEGGKVTAGLLFFCAFLVTPLGLGMLFSYPDKIWLVGILMLLGAGAFIHSGVSNLRQSARMSKQMDKEMKAVAEALKTQMESIDKVASGTALASEAGILARWTYTDEEWKRFIAWETKKRRANTSLEAGLIVVIGAVFAHLIKQAGWALAFCLSTFIAGIYWVGKYFLSMNSIGKKKGSTNEIVILHDGVIINGKYNAIRSELYRVRSIKLLDVEEPLIMEFVYEWKTRKGISNDEIRIPVPEGKKSEAQDLISRVQ